VAEISLDLNFPCAETLFYSHSVNDVRKSQVHFSRRYEYDVCDAEISSEIKSFKYLVANTATDFPSQLDTS
jgi:hypothetical protein